MAAAVACTYLEPLLSTVIDLSAPVDVYAEWIDACETVAKKEVDRELRNANKANAEDRNFSTYGTGDEDRPGAAGDGDDDDDDY